MNFSIVVARYNEDLEWSKQFLNVIIYNKGTPLTDDFTTILLNNVGRESHTFSKGGYALMIQNTLKTNKALKYLQKP